MDRVKFFDFWREYYVAFSRPQNLLVLTGAQSKTRQFGKTFDETVGKIESYKFSNKGVKMCKATCDNCDLRYFCHFK